MPYLISRAVRAGLAVLLLSLHVGAAWAAQGVVDPAFGHTLLPIGAATGGEAHGVAVDASGRIVIVGQDASGDLALMRLTSAGELDPSFGTGGKATAPGVAFARAVALQADGKIVVAGDGDTGAILARYLSDGTLDATFGTGGTVTTGLAATAIAIQPDGKILTAGGSGSPSVFAVARHDSSGALDPTFGSGGIAETPSAGTVAADLAVLAGGDVLAGGSALVRYDSAGTLDASFGTAGLVSGVDAVSLGVQSSGAIVTLATDGTVQRFATDGSADASFGSGGHADPTIMDPVCHTVPCDLAFRELVVDPNDVITIVGDAGFTWLDCGIGICVGVLVESFVLHGFSPDGTVNVGFDAITINGYDFETGFGTDIFVMQRGNALALQPDGRIVSVGTRGESGTVPVPAEGFLVARHLIVPPTCGNDVTELGEQCDRGTANGSPGSCCTIACTYRPASQTCRPSTDACDPAETCTGASAACPANAFLPDDTPCNSDPCMVAACSNGICPPEDPVECPACEACDPIDGCVAAPRTMCRQPTVPFKASLDLKDRAPDDRDQITWKWLKGEATSVADFGEPVFADDYALCIYDESGSEPVTLLGALAPSAEICDPRRLTRCWRASKKGFKYVDRELTPDGLQKIDLREGDEGRAKITAKGKGANLDMPTLPLPLPARVQLQGEHGECWEATFSNAGVRHNDTARFKGKAD